MKGQIFRRPLYVDKPYLEIVFDESGKVFDYRIWKCLQSGKRDWFDVMDLERKRRGWKSGLIGHSLRIWCDSSLIWRTRICLVLRLIQYRKELENTHDAKTALMGRTIKAVWFLSPTSGASLPTYYSNVNDEALVVLIPDWWGKSSDCTRLKNFIIFNLLYS